MTEKKDYSFYYQNEKPWPNSRLKNAVIVGHTTPTTAKLWARCAKDGKHLLFLVPFSYNEEGKVTDKEKKFNTFIDKTFVNFNEVREQFPDSLDKEFETKLETKDGTETIEFEGLLPNQRYRYFLADVFDDQNSDNSDLQVVIDAIPQGVSRKEEKAATGSAGLSFKTLNSDENKPFSFALFSCHNPYVDDDDSGVEIENMSAWDSFGSVLRRHSKQGLIEAKNSKEKDLSFIIAGGDQCYCDGRPSIDIWKYLYKVMHKSGGEIYPSKDDMVSWYRNIYRSYWGFKQVRSVFGMYPTYMIWDDHEICDGWGSYEKYKEGNSRMHPIYKKMEEKKSADKKLSKEDCDVLLERMFNAATQVYNEYQHSHNPKTESGKWHYNFEHGNSNFFVMDGRGHRNINGDSDNKILGDEQMKDFEEYVNDLARGDVLFIVSAVPMIHASSLVTEDGHILDSELADDLKDSWEHSVNKIERKRVMKCLWAATDKGVKVCILSGDVHASAVFKLTNKEKTSVIYQITSSAITYHLPKAHELIASIIVADDGEFDDGSSYERLAYFVNSSFSFIKVDPKEGDVVVSLYDATKDEDLAQNKVKEKNKEDESWFIKLISPFKRHSVSKLKLEWSSNQRPEKPVETPKRPTQGF